MATTELELKRMRGDDVAEGLLLEIYGNDGALITVDTLTLMELTVNTLKNPPDDSTELLVLTGSVIDVAASKVEFSGAWDTLPIGVLYYDVQVTLASGEIWTPVKGRLVILQDLNKV
jgi:hypothetical protein